MSLIESRDRWLKCRPKMHRPAKRMRSGSMKSSSCFEDPRAWSIDPRKRAAYLLDAMAEMSTSSGSEDNIKEGIQELRNTEPTSSIRKTLLKTGSFSADNIFEDSDTDHELIKLNNKLFAAKETIGELQTANENLANEKNKANAEVDNLRIIVKNMQEQMEHLQCSSIDHHPKIRSDDENALERAKLEIDHLTRKIEAYSDIRKWHSEIRQAHHQLTVEKNELMRQVNELYAERSKLLEDLKAKERDVSILERQTTANTDGTKENVMLRDRIAAKDKKIQELNAVVEKQNVVVKELNVKVATLTECFHNKEECLHEEIEGLRKTLEDNSLSISQLEKKLHETELLVAELETLRDQFRATNIALTDSINSYKTDIENAMNSNNQLITVVERLKCENEAKEKEMEKLTLFPQNPNTMLYFSHLNKLVMSVGNLEQLTQDQLIELLENMKGVIVKLKEEMWGANITPWELQIHDVHVQTELIKTDSDVQCTPIVSSALVQTSFPEEYFMKYRDCEREILQLTSKIAAFETTLSEQAVELDSLGTELFDAIEDGYNKELDLEKMTKNNDLLQETVNTLNDQLKNMDLLLKNALTEVYEQAHVHKNAQNMLENTLDTTVTQYSHCMSVLEAFLEQKDEQIIELTKLIENSDAKHRESVDKFIEEIDELKNWLKVEKTASSELNSEVCRLTKSVKDKSEIIYELKGKLEKAEKTVRELIDDEAVTEDVESLHESNDYLSSLCSQVAFYKKQSVALKNNVIQRQKECDHLQRLSTKLKHSTKSLKNIIRRNGVQKKMNAAKLDKLRGSFNKFVRSQKRLKVGVARLETERNRMSESLKEVEAENCDFKKERSLLLQELFNVKNKMADAEKSLEKYKAKHLAHEELKMKMERLLLKSMKKITKYKTVLNARRDEEGNATRRIVESEKLNHEIDLLKSENMSLSTTICSLKQKLSSLLELPEKESSSVELQVTLEEVCLNEGKVGGSVIGHYEEIIAAMKKEHESTSNQSHRQYVNNLKMLKDTYERDINSLRKLHSENIEKMKLMQMEELEFHCRKNMLAELELEKSKLEDTFVKDAAILKSKLENSLKEKEAKFELEKIDLQRKLSIVNEDLNKAYKYSSEKIENLKVNFQNQIQKLEELQRIELELLERRFTKRLEREVENKMRLRAELMDDKETQCVMVGQQEKGTSTNMGAIMRESFCNTEISSVVHRISDFNCLERISCEIKLDNTARDSTQEEACKRILSAFPTGVEDFSASPERAILISRIDELENSLQSQQADFVRKIKLCEKKLKHEQMKAREIANILEQELRYSTDVHCKLGLQYNRAEQLVLENESLSSQLTLCEQQINLIKNSKEDQKYRAILTDFDSGIHDPEGALELEQSLNRLKDKIDEAISQERKLSDELPTTNASIKPKYECGIDQIPQKEYNVGPESERSVPDLKVIVIQQREVTHSWSSQIDRVY